MSWFFGTPSERDPLLIVGEFLRAETRAIDNNTLLAEVYKLSCDAENVELVGRAIKELVSITATKSREGPEGRLDDLTKQLAMLTLRNILTLSKDDTDGFNYIRLLNQTEFLAYSELHGTLSNCVPPQLDDFSASKLAKEILDQLLASKSLREAQAQAAATAAAAQEEAATSRKAKSVLDKICLIM